MKKYALLIGLVCCFASCSADEWDNDVQEINLNNEINPISDPNKDWDKWKNNNNDRSEDDGN